MTIGIVAVTTSVTIPVYRNYQIRSELMDATEQVLTAMRGAQLRARAGETAGTWGVQTEQGVLFQGDSFAERDPAHDERYPIPASVTVSGLTEVVFLPLSGVPVQSGEVVLVASNGDSRTIAVGDQGTVSAGGLSVPSIFSGGGSESSAGAGASSAGGSDGSAGASAGSDGSTASEGQASSGASQAASGQADSSAGTAGSAGADGGTTGGAVSSSSTPTGSEASAGSSSEAGSSTPGGGTATCEDRFAVGPDGTLLTTGTVSATFTVLGSQITYGSGGPDVNVTVQVSTDGGRTWQALFSGNDVDGGETQTLSNLASGTRIAVKVRGSYSWMFNATYVSNSGDGHFAVLRDGSPLPAYPVFDNQQALAGFLRSIVSGDRISIGQYDAVYLAEIGSSLTSTSADFQDLVLRVSFAQEPGSCASSGASSSSSTSSAGSSAGSEGSASSAASSASSDSGRQITICHFNAGDEGNTITISESAWPAHAVHGDRRGACAGDDDDDGIDNAADFCPGTRVEHPRKYLLFFRNALTQRDSDIFRVGPTKKISSYTLDDTGGCSCEQLLDVAEGKPGYYFVDTPGTYLSLRSLLDSYVSTARKYGCSSDLLNFIERGVRGR